MHRVKCYYCGMIFDRDKQESIQIPNIARRYGHLECFKNNQKAEKSEQEDKEALEQYIKKLFNYEVLPEPVNKQIRQYIAEYQYTYKGMLKALKYHYEVKHGDKEKAYGRIGIIPYCYNDAYEYYRSIWEIRQQNQASIDIQSQAKAHNNMNKIEIPQIEVHISSPVRRPVRQKRNIFTFLEEEGLE